MTETKAPEAEIADLRKEVARLQGALDAKMLFDEDSFISNCIFRVREGEGPLFKLIDDKVTIKLDRYAIVPLEQFDEWRQNGWPEASMPSLNAFPMTET